MTKKKKKRPSAGMAAHILGRMRSDRLFKKTVWDRRMLEGVESLPWRTPPILSTSRRFSLLKYHQERLVARWIAALQTLESLYEEVRILPPAHPHSMNLRETKDNGNGTGGREKSVRRIRKVLSPEEDIKRSKLLEQVDRAIFNFVAIDKRGLFSHPLVRARLNAATDKLFGDPEFLEGLASAVHRKGPQLFHGNIRVMLLLKAGGMLEQGMSWGEVYDHLCETGEMEPIEP